MKLMPVAKLDSAALGLKPCGICGNSHLVRARSADTYAGFVPTDRIFCPRCRNFGEGVEVGAPLDVAGWNEGSEELKGRFAPTPACR